MQKNRLTLQEILKGEYGRKVAEVNYEEVNADNVLQILAKTTGIFNFNLRAIEYLWNYKKGDQPILYRQKMVRDDIINKVVENHAYEIVQFAVAQTYGEPLQYVSQTEDDRVNEAVDLLNDYMADAFKYQRNVKQGEWKSAVGTSFLAIQRTGRSDKPFRITVPSPMNTYVVYSTITEEPLMAVQRLKDENNEQYYLCFTDTHQFKVKNGQLIDTRLHAFGGIPIVEVPNNQDRLADTEVVITLLDSINTMQSNRMDGVEQFIQSWIKFVNCDVDEDSFLKMKQSGALVVKSNNGEGNKADVDVMTQELNQSESQVAKDDLWDNALSILAIPNKEGGTTGGDSQGAVELRAGWDFARSRARLKDSYVKESETRFAQVALNVLRIAGHDLGITTKDFVVNIPHSPQDNMSVKANVLVLLLQAGINPLVAIKTSGLWSDAEKVYLNSKDYLDVLYKTTGMTEEELAREEAKAQEIVAESEKKEEPKTSVASRLKDRLVNGV